MENIFIYKSKYNGNQYAAKFGYDFWNPIFGFLNKEPTIEEYREWVIQWRAYEKQLVEAIQFFRKLKNDSVYSDEKRHYWSSKKILGGNARKFYEKRREYKENFKKSDFFQNWSINKNTIKEMELC